MRAPSVLVQKRICCVSVIVRWHRPTRKRGNAPPRIPKHDSQSTYRVIAIVRDSLGRSIYQLVEVINFYSRFPNRSRGTFSCLSKRKYPKRRHPGRCADRNFSDRCPALRNHSRTLDQLAEREKHSLRARTRSSENHRERLRCSAGSTGVFLTATATATALGFAALTPTYSCSGSVASRRSNTIPFGEPLNSSANHWEDVSKLDEITVY